MIIESGSAGAIKTPPKTKRGIALQNGTSCEALRRSAGAESLNAMVD